MGKPFAKELDKIDSVLEWSNEASVTHLTNFLFSQYQECFIVGSGGSISAGYLLSELLRDQGITSKVITPLELYHIKESIVSGKILLLSASGRNKDINFALKTALSIEPSMIGCLTLSESNPLTKKAELYSICESFNYNLPTLKDGFLATNSLIASWALLLKTVGYDAYKLIPSYPSEIWRESVQSFLNSTKNLQTLIVLHGKWGHPVAIDIESKCTEAALTNTQLADYRNFGHGRHHWIAKHPLETAVIALVSDGDRKISNKTLELLPKSIPKLLIETQYENPIAYLDLLIKSFYVIDQLGIKMGIDPGKPGVPEFGRQLYHINPNTYLKLKLPTAKEIAVNRKLKQIKLSNQSNNDLKEFVNRAYDNFIVKILSTHYGSLVIDYDGTLCSKLGRFVDLPVSMSTLLINHLKNGFLIGIATGRGRSVRQTLQNTIPSQYWNQIIIGYYNGTYILPLNEQLPDMTLNPDPRLVEINSFLNLSSYKDLTIDLRTNQLTITTQSYEQGIILLDIINSFIVKIQLVGIICVSSGNSIDVICYQYGSKTSVIDACKKIANEKKIAVECLCIGDKGRYPGNDFALLATPYSLSVDEVSSALDSCWNIAGLGQRNSKAMEEYFGLITYDLEHFRLTLSK